MKSLFLILVSLYSVTAIFSQEVDFEQKVVDIIIADSSLSAKDYYIKKWTYKDGVNGFDILTFPHFTNNDSLKSSLSDNLFNGVSDKKKIVRLSIPVEYKKGYNKNTTAISISNKRTLEDIVFIKIDFIPHKEYDTQEIIFMFSLNGQFLQKINRNIISK